MPGADGPAVTTTVPVSPGSAPGADGPGTVHPAAGLTPSSPGQASPGPAIPEPVPAAGLTSPSPGQASPGPTVPEPALPAAAPASAGRHPGPLRRALAAVSPLHLGLATATAALLVSAVSPVNDLDSYWHVLLGREILARHTVHDLGTQWLGVTPPHWLTAQWLSEVTMAGTVDGLGWRGLVVVRLLLFAAIIGAVLATLLPRRPVALGTGVAAVTLFGLSFFVQDRPQTLSLLFLAVLARSCTRLLLDGHRPRPVLVAAGCLFWAQLHPLWILAPAAFALVALAAALDRPAGCPGRLPGREPVRGALVCLLASAAGLVSPQGPAALLLPLRFREAAGTIAEWRPVTVADLTALSFALLLLLTVLAWARHPGTVSRPVLLWLGAWTAFALPASRNLAPALLMTAPVVVHELDRIWGPRIRSWHRPNRPREGAVLLTATGLVLVAGIGLTAVELARVDPLGRTPARRIAERLAGSPQPVRVFNSYNAAGSLAAFGGGKVRLVVDGRADLWGNAYIEKVVDAAGLGPGWKQTFTSFHPDAVVLTRTAPLTVLLLEQGGWRSAAVDGEYVLLLPAPAPSR